MADLLEERNRLTEKIEENSYSIPLYLRRCQIYGVLGHPDLAAMDAYKALLLVDEVVEESGEYHEEALEAAQHDMCSLPSTTKPLDGATIVEGLERTTLSDSDRELDSPKPSDNVDRTGDHEVGEDEAAEWAQSICAQEARVQLANHLTSIGCLRTAYDFVQQALRNDSSFTPAYAARDQLFHAARAQNPQFDDQNVNVNDLPDRGMVRREIYPWNHHEADRTTPEALELLNQQMKEVAPKLEIRVAELPVLTSVVDSSKPSEAISKQLGVFATEDLEAGEEILHERSLLTANSRLHEPLCDACSSELPELNQSHQAHVQDPAEDQEETEEPVPCDECVDVLFCSQECHDLAQESYHPAVCGLDIESISREVPAAEAADALYTLLLLRAIAMAQTQETHPLDLKEVKYIWGDFTTPASKPIPPNTGTTTDPFSNAPRTLPFTFSANILLPLHLLEKLSIPIFTTPDSLAETWVYNTLYSKFRGTASARLSTRDGRPEVAAVHPLWCLANHSCDPNVRWEWAGDIRFTVREERVAWGTVGGTDDVVGGDGKETRRGGLKKDEEVLNHYVDIDLPVQERREWGVGALGGFCRCERCVWEASQA